MLTITYGPGGFDPAKPDGNIVSRVEAPDGPAADDLSATVDALTEAVLGA